MLGVLAAGGIVFYEWYKKQQQAKTTLIQPYADQGLINNNSTAQATFINVNGATMSAAVADREFQTLIDDGLINKDSAKLGLSAYEKDIVYRDMHPSLFISTAKQDEEASKIWNAHPGLKVL